MRISLTDNLESYVKSKVESGMYSDFSKVIRESLRLMDRFERAKSHQLELLKQAVNIGVSQADEGLLSQRSILDLIKER